MKRTKSVTVRLSENLTMKIEDAAKYAYKNNKSFIIEGLLLYAVQGKSPAELYRDAKDGFYIDARNNCRL